MYQLLAICDFYYTDFSEV